MVCHLFWKEKKKGKPVGEKKIVSLCQTEHLNTGEVPQRLFWKWNSVTIHWAVGMCQGLYLCWVCKGEQYRLVPWSQGTCCSKQTCEQNPDRTTCEIRVCVCVCSETVVSQIYIYIYMHIHINIYIHTCFKKYESLWTRTQHFLEELNRNIWRSLN